jgi:hypothetical protein
MMIRWSQRDHVVNSYYYGVIYTIASRRIYIAVIKKREKGEERAERSQCSIVYG